MHGNSFALGADCSGQSTHNGPGANELRQGWDIRPLWTIWDGTEGRLPTLCRGGGSCC